MNQKVQLKNPGGKRKNEPDKRRKTNGGRKQLGSSKLKLGQILPGQKLV